MRFILATALAVTLATVATAHPAHEKSAAVGGNLPASAQPAAAVVDAFHAALRRGDTQTAKSLLAEEALIFESGGVERSKAEYASHHLPADAEFERSVSSSTTSRTGGSSGDLAWIATEGRTTGTFKGKALDRLTTESMLLRRFGDGWKIVHVHWSSAAKPDRAATTTTGED